MHIRQRHTHSQDLEILKEINLISVTRACIRIPRLCSTVSYPRVLLHTSSKKSLSTLKDHPSHVACPYWPPLRIYHHSADANDYFQPNYRLQRRRDTSGGEGIHSVMRAVYSGECPHLKNDRFQVNREPCSLDPWTNKNKKTPNQQGKKSKKKEMKLKRKSIKGLVIWKDK